MEILAAVLGFVGGVLAGLFGVGGGILFVPTLVLVLGLTQVHAEATSLLAILPTVLVGTWRQRRHGNVDLRAMFWLLLGSIPGVLLTSKLTLRLPDQALRLGLATVLMLSGVKLVNTPGADWIVLAGFIAGGIVLAAWGIRELREQRREAPLATELPLS